MKYKKKTLKNGLRILTVPVENSKTVTVLVLVEAGSKYEDKKQNGISHFLEHMCFKGTLKRPNHSMISHELDALGSESNAMTSFEFTGYYAKANKKHTSKILDIISDIYLNSTFPEMELEKEKGVILEEINMYEDNPQRKVSNLFLKLLYGDQPAGRTILGEKEIIKNVSRNNFLSYRSKHYVASNTVVIVAGSIKPKEIENEVVSLFSSIPVGKRVGKVKVIERQSEPKILAYHKKTDQTHLILGVRAYAMADKRMPALQVLCAILGQGMSSRLFKRVRGKMGAAYYVRSAVSDFTDHGVLEISAGIDKKRYKEIIEAMLQEMKLLKENLVSKAELSKAKEYIIGNFTMGLETTDALAEYFGIQEVLKRKIESPEKIEQKIRKVSAKDVQKIANDIFTNNKLNLAIIGDGINEQQLRNILKF